MPAAGPPAGSSMEPQGAVARLVETGWAVPAAPGPSPDESAQRAEGAHALRHELELERQHAQAEVQHQAQRQAELRQQLDGAWADAEQLHEAIAASLADLAARLDRLSTAGSAASTPPPLLSLGLDEGYAAACSTLLDSLAGYVEHHFSSGGGGGGLAAAQAHQRQCRELEQLQRGLCKAERLRVQEEAELARLQAELGVLQAPGANAAASLGYSAADLEAELASLQRRRAASLPLALAATEATAAEAAGAGAVAEQCVQRGAELEQRLQAKQQVAAMLTRHLARQLLVQQLLRHEQTALQQVLMGTLAARDDADCVAQAAASRLPDHDTQPAAQAQRAGAQSAATAAAGAGSAPADESTALSTAQQLIECRAELQRLAQQVHSQLLRHHAVVAQLAGLLYGPAADGSGIGVTPQLSPPQLQAELAVAEVAHQALQLQAHAVMAEVTERQQAPQARRLAEQVLLAFWAEGEGGAAQLQALADKNQQRLGAA